MKNAFPLTFLIIALFTSCSKDKPEYNEFPTGVIEVLNILNGTFIGEEYSLGQLYRTDNLTFTPFDVPMNKTGFRDGTISAHGIIHRVQDKAVGGKVVDDYYFNIDASSQQITLYSYNTDSKELNEVQEKYKYNIKSPNTVQLLKYGLSDDNWIIYSKQ